MLGGALGSRLTGSGLVSVEAALQSSQPKRAGETISSNGCNRGGKCHENARRRVSCSHHPRRILCDSRRECHHATSFRPPAADPSLAFPFLASRSRFGLASATAVALLPLLLGPEAVRAATYTVSDSNWGTSTTVNSFAWALAQANGNLGADTISITPGLAINVDGATEASSGWLTTISDTLTIEGHGATLVGDPRFITNGVPPIIYNKINVDAFQQPPDFLIQQAFSFAKLHDGVSLSIDGLNSDGLNGFLQLGAGSTASISNATARNSVSYGVSARSVFEALDGSTLKLSQVVLEHINPALDSIGPAWSGAIAGTNATLHMVRSTISRAAAAAGAVVWSGGTANVVSSLINESGGLSVRDDSQPGVMNLVNSLVSVSAQNSDIQRLQAFGGGELNITASSILQDALYNSYNACNSEPYDCAGKPLTAFNGGTITLRQSVVSLINSQFPGLIPAGVLSYSSANLFTGTPGQLVALDAVWLQTTPNQSASALQTLFGNPNLLTAGDPLLLEDLGGGLSAYLPWPGGAYPNRQGPLIDQISDADGANQLINPINGNPIFFDVFGQPRTSNGLRTIGAVQRAPVPGPLPLAGASAALAWSRRLRRRIRLSQVSEPTAASIG